jgi:DNA-binding MarR family transcriptional regulator
VYMRLFNGTAANFKKGNEMAGKLGAASVASPDCHCLALRQAARGVTRFYDDLLAPAGLRTTQFSILARLHRLGPMPINTLADVLALDRTTLGRNLLPLRRKGLIAASRRGEDRRSKPVQVTRAGVARLKAAAQLWGEAQARFEAAFGARRLRALRALLDELTRAGRRLARDEGVKTAELSGERAVRRSTGT